MKAHWLVVAIVLGSSVAHPAADLDRSDTTMSTSWVMRGSPYRIPAVIPVPM